MKQKVAIALNTAWNAVNFRRGLITVLVAEGYEVVVIAPSDKYAEQIVSLGARFVHLSMDNKGTHPGRDLLLFFRFYMLLRKEKPSAYLGYTIKPNIYGSLAAHALGIPVLNNIAGLGSVFVKKTFLTWFVKCLYRIALSRSTRVFFQNDDDLSLFINEKIIKAEKAKRLPGSGVNLRHFAQVPLPDHETPGRLRFLLVARMLWDKGVGEFVAAARLLKQQYPNVEFCLLGFLDAQNPTAILASQINEWVAEGVVRYLGVSDDVRIEIAKADCLVLPSFYREGTPRTLLEAAALGRPIITTRSVGCRDTVDEGINGYLCAPRDALDLADKIKRIISLSPTQRAEMGEKSRKKAEREFDEQIVVQNYLDALIKNI